MFYRLLPIGTVIITLLATAWLTLLPLNWVTEKNISDKYLTFLTPASFTFSIWGLIYLSWLIISVMIALKQIEVGKKMKIVFGFSTLLTAFWLVPWHQNDIFTSLLVILLIFAWFSFLFFGTRKKDTNFLFQSMIDLTYGWVIVATLLDLFVYMNAIHIVQDSQSMLFIALFWLFIWTIVHIILMNGFKAYIPAFVYIWALRGMYYHQHNISIKLATTLFSIILLINFIYLRRKSYKEIIQEGWQLWSKEKLKKKRK